MYWKDFHSQLPLVAGPEQESGPPPQWRTIWLSVGKALWADHCQVRLCFNSRHFNAGFCAELCQKQEV